MWYFAFVGNKNVTKRGKQTLVDTQDNAVTAQGLCVILFGIDLW